MPKIVDHDRQREKFANAAIRLIARDGFEGMTMRAVAAESGLSYGSLFHYFDSKDELLMYAVRLSTRQQTRRVNDYATQHTGLQALRHLLCDDSIVSETTRDDSMVWLAFIYKAALNEPFSRMHDELIEGWLERIENLIRDAQVNGEVSKAHDAGFEAMAIWVYSAGISQQGLLDPVRLTPALQKQLINAYLNKLAI